MMDAVKKKLAVATLLALNGELHIESSLMLKYNKRE